MLKESIEKLKGTQTTKILVPLFLYKLFLFIFIFSSLELLPNLGLNGQQPNWTTCFLPWDTSNYLMISGQGYTEGSKINAFYPLWPLVMLLASPITLGNHLVAGLLMSNIFSFLAIVLFHYRTSRSFNPRIADIATMLLLAFPASFFYVFPYSESLFLLLIILLFLCLDSEKYWLLAVVSFFLPLTRAIGVFCIFPIIWELFRKKKEWHRYLVCFFPVAGYALYFLIMYLFTGNAFDGFEVQKVFPTKPSLGKLFHPVDFFFTLISPRELHGFGTSYLDRTCFVIFLASLVPPWRIKTSEGIYAAIAGIIPAVTVSFMSFQRYLSVVFPLFVIWALLLESERIKYVRWFILLFLFSIQLVFIIRHINYKWVA